MVVEAEFTHANDDEQEKKWHLSTAAVPVDNNGLIEYFNSNATHLDEKIAQYSALGSGWIVSRVLKLSLVVSQFTELCRLSGQCHFETPPLISNKKCCINIQNNDNLCFLYAVLAALKYDAIPNGCRSRAASYEQYMNELQYDAEEMPMQIINIPRFERRNPQVAVNVIKYTPPSLLARMRVDEEAEIFKHPCFDLIYRSKSQATEDVKVVHLLLVENKEKQFHYMAITQLERLLNCNPSERCNTHIRNHVCHSCLRLFRLQSTLDTHKPMCETLKIFGTVFTAPEKNHLEFDQWQKTIPPKFIVYGDFESILERPGDDLPTSVVQVHMPTAAGALVLDPYGGSEYKHFDGEDCVVDFMKHLEVVSKEVYQWYEDNAHEPMRDLCEIEEEEHREAAHCYLCKKRFNNRKKGRKVHDHDHFTGQYLGAACNSCNLARRIPKKPVLPVVFHNFRGYDAHHLLKHAANRFTSWEFSCIAQSSEKFQSVTAYVGKKSSPIRFIDSLQFLCSSLQNLSSLLQPDEKRFINSLRNELPEEARSGKGIFPYSFITSREVLEQLRDDLPPRDEAFYDMLSDSVNVTEADFERARSVWRLCGCTSLKDYMLIYLKVDVYLLADVFETFRKTAICEDNLDPANFFGIPGLSWCAALKSMSKELELLKDLEMYSFFESGVRGGMTFVNKHQAVHDAETQLLYIDINNLYGWALSQQLPARGFRWILEQAELDDIARHLPDENAAYGYLLEVDISVPE